MTGSDETIPSTPNPFCIITARRFEVVDRNCGIQRIAAALSFILARSKIPLLPLKGRSRLSHYTNALCNGGIARRAASATYRSPKLTYQREAGANRKSRQSRHKAPLRNDADKRRRTSSTRFRPPLAGHPMMGLAASQLYFEKRHACDWAGLRARLQIEMRNPDGDGYGRSRSCDRISPAPGEVFRPRRKTTVPPARRRIDNSSISKSFRTKPRRRGSKAMESTFLST